MPNLCGLEPQLIKLEFIIYLPKLKVGRMDDILSDMCAMGLQMGPN